MKKFIPLVLASCFGVWAGLATGLRPAHAEGTTLYGLTNGSLPNGTVDLDFEFKDPRSGTGVATRSAKAHVHDGMYLADLNGTSLPAGLYAMTVRVGGAVVQAATFVELQATTPGTQQTGNVNISGTLLAGKIGVPTANSGAQINGISSAGLIGVRGQSNATGVVGASNGVSGVGVSGVTTSATGPTSGVSGSNASADGFAIRGNGGPGTGGRFESTAPNGVGLIAQGADGGRFNAIGPGGQALVANSEFIGLRAFTPFATGVGVDTQGFLGVRAAGSTVNGIGVIGGGFVGGEFNGTTGVQAFGRTGIFASGNELAGKFTNNTRGTGISVEGGLLGGTFVARENSGAAVKGLASLTSTNNFGGDFESLSATGRGVRGRASATSGANFGGWFTSSSTTGTGAIGTVTAATGNTIGLFGTVTSSAGKGVVGEATATTGANIGGDFVSNSGNGTGIRGRATATAGPSFAGSFVNSSNSGTGVNGLATAGIGSTIGVLGEVNSPSGVAVSARNNSTDKTVSLGGPNGSIHTTGSLHVVGKTSKNYGSARRSFAPAAFGTIFMLSGGQPVINCSSGNISVVRDQDGEVELGVDGFTMTERNSACIVTAVRSGSAAVMTVGGGSNGRLVITALDIDTGLKKSFIFFTFVIYDCRLVTLGDSLEPEDNRTSPP